MKTTVLSIIFALVLIGGALMFAKSKPVDVASNESVTIVDGRQIIDISAKGGYSPRKTMAKAGIPTTIRFVTSGTFDCSLAVRIPGMQWSKMLPPTGTTELDVGTPKVGSINGTCSMGMYYFQIDFVE